MKATRRPDATQEDDLKPGEYTRWKLEDLLKRWADLKPEELEPLAKQYEGGWYSLYMPAMGQYKAHMGRIVPNVHTVTENEDGTITVSPSIKQSSWDGTDLWHGYLENDVWRVV